jgi:hypothetical protein
MTPLSIFKLLLGNRTAILAVASSRWSLLVGAILVLTGSLARNYDGACFPEEWPALGHGLVVSTFNAFVLFSYACLASRARARGLPYFRGFLSFLGLFWMTAPMAWLYGIPYERMMSPLDALHTNMWTLALVSIWRVTLVSRLLAVLLGERSWRIIWLVLAFADVELLLALKFAPLPVIDFMGGLQQTPEERELGSTAFLAGFWGVITLPIWLIGALVASARMEKNTEPTPILSPPSRAPLAAIAFALIMLAAWIVAAIHVHPEQRNRYNAEQLLRGNQIDSALALMSGHPRSDYPPVWDPPPRPAWQIYEPSIDAIRTALAEKPHAKWVDDLFWDKCWRHLRSFEGGGFAPWTPVSDWDPVDREHPSAEWWHKAELHAAHDSHLSAQDREDLRAAIQAWKKLTAPSDSPAPSPSH